VLVATVRRLWDDAGYREERYAATELLNTASARRLRSMELLPPYRELIVSGAWWDYVDEVAHRVADLRADFPLRWIRCCGTGAPMATCGCGAPRSSASSAPGRPPEWARGYVTEHETQLSPLSRREAMRNIRDGAHR